MIKAYLTVNFNDEEQTTVNEIPYTDIELAISEMRNYLKTPGVSSVTLILLP